MQQAELKGEPKILFFPGLKPGVNEHLREAFAQKHLVVEECWGNCEARPRLEVGEETHKGIPDIQKYVGSH